MMAYHQRVNQFRSRIDFDDPSTTKPPSLAKSAVLQALEEEERQQSRGRGLQQLLQGRPSRSRQRPDTGAPGTKKPCINRETVLRINRRPVRHRSCDGMWPPRSPSPAGHSLDRRRPTVGSGPTDEGLKRVAWPPGEGADDYVQHQSNQPQQQQQQYYQPQQQVHQPQQQQQQPATYQQYQQPPHQQPQHPQQPRERIIPIQRPEQQLPQYQPQPTQAFQPLVPEQQLYQQQPQQQQQQQQQFHQEQPNQVPFFTRLRSEPPMSQESAPVYQTQPVAAIYQGGSNMRGDQKWPPAEYKKQSELENEERIKLAHQPAFRPRKVQKDYSNFFAKNALNQTYPGYRAPPGTQHHS